jgi:hypothetical protein
VTRNLRLLRRLGLRRLLGATLFALQAVIAVSWIAEPTQATRLLGAHVEEPGTQHADLHDEATCPVCAVRLSHVAPAPTGDFPAERAQLRALPPAEYASAPAAPFALPYGSRAPPVSLT